jgi:signal transduction histidine kinase
LRKTVEAATIDEARLAAEHTQESQRTYRLLLYITLAGATLIVVIGAISVALVQRSAQQRESARAELEATNANLERIVEHRTADLTEANREVQRFAYIVSHDLRSPLVNIMGFTSELEELHRQIFTQFNRLSAEVAAHDAQAASAAVAGAPSAGQLAEDFDEAIRFIKRSIANMDRLINAVLKLSREGRRDFQPERIDMNALIEGIAATMTHRAVELGATIAVGPLPEIETDRLAVEQIFANLIDNGLKYGRDGVPLYIEITGRTDATYAFFDIRDNGRGIAPEDHERVFELFRRAGLPDRQGEGIGLAYVRAQVRRLGGMVDLSSTLGEGSTFTIRLPRQWATGQRSTT